MSNDYAPEGMTDQEYEAEITQAIASTCHFTSIRNGRQWQCLLCHEKFSSSGRELNERMLIHYQWFHLSKKSAKFS